MTIAREPFWLCANGIPRCPSCGPEEMLLDERTQRLLYVRAHPFVGAWHRVLGDPADVFGLSPSLCGAQAPIELSGGRQMWGQIAVDATPSVAHEVAVFCAACIRARLQRDSRRAC